jgi:Fic family protein
VPYAHPFYDGNGRTGRYLLALYLSEPLSLITSLSLSRAIAERKDAYYRSFRTVEDPLNHGELTFFVLEMLGSIERAQEEILADLERKESQLVRVAEKIPDVAERFALSDKEAVLLDHFAQIQLFAPLPDVTLDDVSAWLGLGEKMARARIGHLEDAGLVHATRRRPLRFALTPQALGSLDLETSENEAER